jgi:hypothetical protein
VRYPREFAVEELAARVDEIPGALGFQLASGQKAALWRVGSAWVPANPSHLRYLLSMLLCAESASYRLSSYVFADARSASSEEGPSPDSLRQVKKRLREEIAERTRIPADRLFVEANAGRLPRLAPDLGIFGAIEERVRPHR